MLPLTVSSICISSSPRLVSGHTFCSIGWLDKSIIFYMGHSSSILVYSFSLYMFKMNSLWMVVTLVEEFKLVYVINR